MGKTQQGTELAKKIWEPIAHGRANREHEGVGNDDLGGEEGNCRAGKKVGREKNTGQNHDRAAT